MESLGGVWKYTNVCGVLQQITDVHLGLGHPMLSPKSTIDFVFSIDAAASGVTVASVAAVHTRDGHGARDVRNCHPLGLGEVPDTFNGFMDHFGEVVALLNGGCQIFI